MSASLGRLPDVLTQSKSFSSDRLFGSHATGTPTPDSDVDLLVVMSMDVPRHERAASIRALFRPSPFPMDTLVFTPEEVEYWRGTVNHIITEAFESGEVLYERQE